MSSELQVIGPTWDVFERLVKAAKSELLICAPWISPAGVERLERLLNAPPGIRLNRIHLWCRLADINTDAPGILQLVRKLEKAGVPSIIRDSPSLHAKVYLADRTLALVTSANLSDAGFSTNLEIAVTISSPEGIAGVARRLEEIKPQTTLVEISALEEFLEKQWPLIQAQKPPRVGEIIVPVWRKQSQSVRQKSAADGTTKINLLIPQPAPVTPTGVQSRSVDLMEVIKTVEKSIQAATEEMQYVDLKDWVGKKVSTWVCPCYVTQGISPYLSKLSSIFSLGEMELGQRLMPERFTNEKGKIERILDGGRALFRKKGAREARIELTRFPDRGSKSPLNNTDSRFLLKITADE